MPIKCKTITLHQIKMFAKSIYRKMLNRATILDNSKVENVYK